VLFKKKKGCASLVNIVMKGKNTREIDRQDTKAVNVLCTYITREHKIVVFTIIYDSCIREKRKKKRTLLI